MRAASLDTGKTFMSGPGGRWAGEHLLAAMKAGKPFSPKALRTLDVLRKDEWVYFDKVLVEEGKIRLRGVADLLAAGLTIAVANAMGKTLMEWEKVQEMTDAEVSLAGIASTEDDRGDFELDRIPLPILHKDFKINLRTLVASRTLGEALDTTQARTAGRLVAEKQEYILFNGSKTFGGNAIYGYLTHPDRNEITFHDNEHWDDAGKTGEEILTDVLAAIAALEADKFYGPYWVYVPSGYSGALELDFKANSDKTIRQRLMEVDRVQKIQVADQLTADHVVVMQPTQDVACILNGEPLQTIQWDIHGGFQIVFKAFCIQIPLIRSNNGTAVTDAVFGGDKHPCGICVIHDAA